MIATGRARMNAARMLTREKGMAVKTRWNGKPLTHEQLSAQIRTWDDAVQANINILRNKEDKAHSFIKNVVETSKRPVTVSYSGGNDSLATLLLVRDVVADFDILFADTGLEFSETIANVKETAEKL